MYDMPQYIPQGWQCPVCKRVYAPDVRSCDYCGAVTITGTIIGKVPNKDGKSLLDKYMSIYEKAMIIHDEL